MVRKEIKFFAIKNITQATEKNSLYFVKGDSDSAFKFYITDLDGNLVPLTGINSSTSLLSSDESIVITGTTIKNLVVSPALQALISTSLQSGDNISELLNDANYITIADIPSSVTKTSELINDGENGIDAFITIADIPSSVTKTSELINDGENGIDAFITIADIPASVFNADTPVILSSGKSLGKYTNGQTIPSAGKTFEEVIKDIALEYVNPSFSSFTVSSQPTTVEVGTTLSGSKTFNWGITLNSGIIPTIDIYDNTAGATLLAATPNDGTQSQSITTIQLNTNGATQSWKGIANNSNGANVNSNNFVVTSLYNRFWGAVSTLPLSSVDGTSNRVYANLLTKAVKTNGTNTFTLTTGTTSNKFIVLLPPGITITSVIDTGYLDLNLTSDYILSTITIKDAGGTDRTYNQYLFNPAGAYPVSTNHVITTN